MFKNIILMFAGIMIGACGFTQGEELLARADFGLSRVQALESKAPESSGVISKETEMSVRINKLEEALKQFNLYLDKNNKLKFKANDGGTDWDWDYNRKTWTRAPVVIQQLQYQIVPNCPPGKT